MKKFYLFLSLLFMMVLVGCNKEPLTNSETEKETQFTSSETESEAESETESETQHHQSTEDESLSTVIKPIDSTIDITNLSDGTFSVQLEEGAFYRDEAGNIQVVVTVYNYDSYRAEDMKNLQLNDTIQIQNETITVTSLEETPLGNIIVNGGLEMGGYDFTTKDGSLYYIIGYSDTKDYYEIGLATLPVSEDFAFYDEMDNRLEPFHAEDFLVEKTEFYYSFSQYNTTIELKDGYVVKMTRIYTP